MPELIDRAFRAIEGPIGTLLLLAVLALGALALMLYRRCEALNKLVRDIQSERIEDARTGILVFSQAASLAGLIARSGFRSGLAEPPSVFADGIGESDPGDPLIAGARALIGGTTADAGAIGKAYRRAAFRTADLLKTAEKKLAR